MTLSEKFRIHCKGAPFWRVLGYVLGISTLDGKKRTSWFGLFDKRESLSIVGIAKSFPNLPNPRSALSSSPRIPSPQMLPPSLTGSSMGLTGLPMGGYSATGFQNMTGFSSMTGLQGVTGVSFAPTIPENEWDNPVKAEDMHKTYYHVKGTWHCGFGPAMIPKNGTSPIWCIKGSNLSNEQISIMKNILEDIRVAPLYINDPVFKYAAKHVLKG